MSTMESFAAADPVRGPGGADVFAAFSVPVEAGDSLILSFVGGNSERPQGVAIRCEGGVLDVAGTRASCLHLWRATAPPRVEVEVRSGSLVVVSNRWQMPDGTVHEWLNNYGMLITPTGANRWRLACSDGWGEEPEYDDLVVDLCLRSHRRALSARGD